MIRTSWRGPHDAATYPRSVTTTPPSLHDLSALEPLVFDAVLFDMDGTLIDSTPSVERSWVTWALEHGVDPNVLHGNHGVPAAQIVAKVLPAERVAAAVARITELEVADVTGIVVLPGAAEALRALPAGRCAIVTSCTRPLAQARIAASGLSAPGVVVTADDVVSGKPDPEPYRLGAQRLGFDPARCLVVEDAPSGLLAGRLAGAATLAVTTTTPASGLKADAVVTNLADVRFWVTDHGVRVGRP